MLHIQSSDIAWPVSRCSTRTHFICKKSQGKGDNSVSHLYSHQTLLGKFLDVVQEEIVYVKSDKVREIIQFVTDNIYTLSRSNTKRQILSHFRGLVQTF